MTYADELNAEPHMDSTKKCAECGATFTPEYRKQRCCSEECRLARQRQRKSLADRESRRRRREQREKRNEPVKYGRKTRHLDTTFELTAEERIAMGLRPLNPGPRPCAKCGTSFYSWDRTSKVLCSACTSDAREYAPDAVGITDLLD